MQKLYVFVGVPASGKSTYAKIHMDGIDVLSGDEFRKKLLKDETDQSNNELVFGELYKKARQILKSGKDLVIDGTNINEFERKRVLSQFSDFELERIAVYFCTALEKCYARDEKRDRTVGRDVIDDYASRFEMPTIEEGFDKIEIVDMNEFWVV